LEQLKLKVEGKCTGRYGYTIVVTTGALNCLMVSAF
jgi:hypothetical protein